MKKLFFLALLCAFHLTILAQNGLPFQKLTWKEAMELAKKEDKIILAEAADTGRINAAMQERLVTEVFGSEDVAKIIAKNFICVRMDPMNETDFNDFAPYLYGSSWPVFMMIYATSGDKVGEYYEILKPLTDRKGFATALQEAANFADLKRSNTHRINFQAMSLEEAKKKAKAEHKLIFVDAMFEGCHWCKKMEMDTYHRNSVADFYNDNFICLQIDFVKEKQVAAVYKTIGFPSYFYIDGNGKQVFFANGYTKDEEKFIGYGKTALAKQAGAN